MARLIGDPVRNAITDADADGIIGFWNNAAARGFGFSEAAAIGQSLDVIIPENRQRRHRDDDHVTMRVSRTRYGAGDPLSVPTQRTGGA